MRWFGPNDPVSLDDIAQAGARGVVSALHHIPAGEVWSEAAIGEYKSWITEKNLDWKVVESLPVHEQIKTRRGDFEKWIDNYKQSLLNLSRQGIEVVTYNFMPLLDWVRTDVAYSLPDGSEALLFDKLDYGVFDLLLLQRPGAKSAYSQDERKAIEARYAAMPDSRRKALEATALLGLPGSEEPFTREEVLERLAEYAHLDRTSLRDNLFLFLSEICPVAERVEIYMAIHPDDPPFSVLGLPRVVSTAADIDGMMRAVPSTTNGLCFCTGSLGARPDNDLIGILKAWGSRVRFLHLRSTRRDAMGNFMEAPHLDGDADMYALMLEIVRLMEREGRGIPMRPDHGHKMLDDLGKTTYPGYTAIGRLKGLAELRGLEYAIRRNLSQDPTLGSS